MSLWGRAFAAGYDRFMASTEEAGLRQRRAELLRQARGRVLELGAGTGANIVHYPADIDELVLSEPEEPMAQRLERRLAATGRRGRVVRAPAEALPFPDGSFDTVVCTLVLCTVRDQQSALAEVARVLAPGGQLLFLEHVRADEPRVARWQDRITPVWRRIGHGCHPNRSTLQAIQAAGFSVAESARGEMPKAPSVFRPLDTGRAIVP